MGKNWKGHAGRGGGNKNAPLTHFLCFPLVNESSASQLANSLAEFKSKIPSKPTAGFSGTNTADVPLVPDDAIRPLGTLHFTLGVMSLPTKERLQEALDFLQSLDLESMLKDAEAQTRLKSPQESEKLTNMEQQKPLQPPTIGLISLSALPKPRSATILHAQPLDPTSRLYPFSVSLRDKFIEAGFMKCEMVKGSNHSEGQKLSQPSSSGRYVSPGGSESEGNANLPTIRNAASTAQNQERKIPRPLLLHATVANTIYAKGPPTYSSSGKRKREVYKFDATELLAMFSKNSNTSSSRPQSQFLPNQAIPYMMAQGNQASTDKPEGQTQARQATSPFIWAKDIVLDRLCICEMGAKPVPIDEATRGPPLGEAYTVVGQKLVLPKP